MAIWFLAMISVFIVIVFPLSDGRDIRIAREQEMSGISHTCLLKNIRRISFRISHLQWREAYYSRIALTLNGLIVRSAQNNVE